MNYWYGYRVVELDGTNPGRKCLSGPFSTYDNAKLDKEKYRARDMEHTAIFSAESKESADSKLDSESFNRL